MGALFGPAGASDSFYDAGNKSSLQMCKWLADMGLDAYEYQCNKGVKIKQEMANKLGGLAKEHKIALSVHAPYYISLSTDDELKRNNSIGYIIQTLEAANNIGATKIVVHSGAAAKITREQALHNAKTTLSMAQSQADSMNLGHIHICPETMGKINQLGDLNEVMELCLVDDRFIPTIDFGHLHTRSLGGLNERSDFEKIFDTMQNRLGTDRLNVFHSHFSRIEFTAGGEKKHHTYADTQYGPDFDFVAELIYKKSLSPTIICESRGTQAEDAKVLKDIYFSQMKLG